MISLEERRLVLITQIHHLEKQLDKLKRQDQMESLLGTYTGRRAYVSLVDLIESLDSKGK